MQEGEGEKGGEKEMGRNWSRGEMIVGVIIRYFVKHNLKSG